MDGETWRKSIAQPHKKACHDAAFLFLTAHGNEKNGVSLRPTGFLHYLCQYKKENVIMKNILAFAALALCMVSCTIDGHGTSEYGKGLLEKGTVAPDITLLTAERPDGIRLSELRGGYVLIEFWASWCPDCQEATPEMKRIYDAYAERGLTMVGVSFDEDEEQWSAYIEENGLYWMQHLEGKPWRESAYATLYNVRWIPTLYLIDPEGKVDFATVDVKAMGDTLAARRFSNLN